MSANPDSGGVKVRKELQSAGGAGFRKYRTLQYGRTSLGYVIRAELCTLLVGGMAGAPGYALRRLLYPGLFGSVAGKPVIGRNVTLRHAQKIRLGRNVIIDDNVVLDAKGETNRGISIGDGVFIGRNSIIYCKNGNITLEAGVNISSNCTVFSSNELTIGANTMIGGYSYILSGGEYDYRNPAPFADQSGMETRGPLTIGENCWLGARVTVLDAANLGAHSVIGAGAVVAKPIPPDSLAVGIPARVVKTI